YKALDMENGKKNPIVKSVISNVTVGAIDPNSGEVGDFPNKGRIQVSFVEFSERHSANTSEVMDKIREAVKGIPGAEVTVDKESNGPPLPKPVVVEITGENLDTLVSVSQRLQKYLSDKQIAGVEQLRSDFQANKPEII